MNRAAFQTPQTVFWFRRDLRLEDNTGLFHALNAGRPVLPLFIFDRQVLKELPDKTDPRVQFIHQRLHTMQETLLQQGSCFWIEQGTPVEVWERLLQQLPVAAVYANHDYEPYAQKRDESVFQLLQARGIPFHTYKDQVIFEKDDILNQQGKPYQVFTPYRNRWIKELIQQPRSFFPAEKHLPRFVKWSGRPLPSLSELGFRKTAIEFPPAQIQPEILLHYHQNRDYPAIEGTSRLGIHLRFGTISIRKLVQQALEMNETFLNELIWREFFMMILWHYPHTLTEPFQEKYQQLPWRQDEADFRRWCEGRTGFPLVDAGMRQLNATGFMHNRVRMVTANFLTRLLRIDWRWGERYFAEKLLDFELSSNVGNWQWAAGCGVDAAPYFRIFNPNAQLKKFDPDEAYVKKWIPEYGSADYPQPMLDYPGRRREALGWFKMYLQR